MVKLLDLIQQKLELFRIEQRYTKRRHRRSTFVSGAVYVDGEYIYTNPPALNTTGSSTNSSSSHGSSTPKGPSKRHSIINFRPVQEEEEEEDRAAEFEQKQKTGSWGRSLGRRWNAGKAHDKNMSTAMVREGPTWVDEESWR